MKPEPEFDEKLWFTMGDCCSGRHYLLYNPHTFVGRMGAWCPLKKVQFCVSKSEVEECSSEARYWIEGFLKGNEPDAPLDDFGDYVPDEDPRFKRWRENIKQFSLNGHWNYDEEPLMELSRSQGIIIRMYVEAGEQRDQTHFHAYYGDDVAIFSVSPIEMVAGTLLRRQQWLIEARAELHEDELIWSWELLQDGEAPRRILPL